MAQGFCKACNKQVGMSGFGRCAICGELVDAQMKPPVGSSFKFGMKEATLLFWGLAVIILIGLRVLTWSN